MTARLLSGWRSSASPNVRVTGLLRAGFRTRRLSGCRTLMAPDLLPAR
jgi:hypothetical protein